MKCIGIDIGSFSVKVFEVQISSKELQLVDFNEFPLNTNPTYDNKILILDILKNLAENNDPTATKYVLCLPQRQVSTRYKVFPFKERSKVLKTIPFELDEDIPFDLENSVFDAKFIKFKGSSSEVLASATPKKNVIDLLEVAQSVGIDPDVIGAQGLAIANLVEDFNNAPPVEVFERTAEEQEPFRTNGHVLLDIGHSTTVVTVYREFRLVGIRTIDWGGSDVAAAISQRYKIQQSEALKELQSKAFILTNQDGASRDQIIFSDTIAGSFAPLLRDLRLYMLDVETEFNMDLTHVALIGGTSQIKNLSAYLSKKIDKPVGPLDTFERFPATHLELTPQMRATAGLALSLAIEGTKRPNNPPTNFRREELGKQSKTLQIFWSRWGYAAKLAAACLICFYFYGFAKGLFSEQVTEQSVETLREQARVAGLKGAEARPSGIRSYIRKKQREIKGKETLAQLMNMNSPLDLLAQLSSSIPSGKNLKLDISYFEVENEKISMKGTVATADQLKALEAALKGLSRDGQVSSQAATGQAARAQFPFSFEFSVDRKISQEGAQ